MSGQVSRSHTFTFSIYGTPTLDQLEREIARAKQVLGGSAKIRIRTSSDQRDGDSLTATVTGELPPDWGG